MWKLFKRFEKQAVTVVMVVLMITFLAQVGSGRGTSRRNDPVIGHVGDEPIYQSELTQSNREWAALKDYVLVDDPSSGQEAPIAAQILGPQIFRQIGDRPELFMLLRHEAHDAPLQVNSDELQSLKQTYYHRPATAEDPEDIDAAVDAGLADLLLINQNFQRLLSDIKFSQPARLQMLAEFYQEIKLNLVELDALDFASKVPPPTTQQVQQQFDRLANTAPGDARAADNPFGFGYQLPDRLKLQYIEIDRNEAEKAVESTKSAYDWDVAGRLYYLQHKDQFPTTQPATTAPTVHMGPGAPSTPLALNVPTTEPYQPYAQVKDQALRAVRDPMVDKLMLDVQGQIVAGLTADSRSASATTAPSDNDARTALARLAATVGLAHHLTLYPTDRTDTFVPLADLTNGAKVGPIADASAGSTPFDAMVKQQAASYLLPPQGVTPSRAALMLPSSPLTDFAHNVYIYRIIDARLAEPAPNLAAVRDQVVADLRTAAGYDVAKAAANGLLGVAKSKTLEAAATSAGKKIISTDPFDGWHPDPGPQIPLSDASRLAFFQQSFGLLGSYNPTSNPHPVSLIELPQDRRFFIAQLASVTPQWNGTRFDEGDMEIADRMRRQASMGMKLEWWNDAAVVQRLKYKPVKSKED